MRHHIADTRKDRKGLSLCGAFLDTSWHFLSADHALLSIRAGSYNIPCPECSKVVIEALQDPDNAYEEMGRVRMMMEDFPEAPKRG